MRINQITDRIRNDFWFTSKCECCDHEIPGEYGYADAYFCLQILPDRKCPKCGYSTNDMRALIDQGLPYKLEGEQLVTTWNRVKYVGVLGLLARCSGQVSEELRDCIETALADACEDGTLKYFKTSDGGFDIEPVK